MGGFYLTGLLNAHMTPPPFPPTRLPWTACVRFLELFPNNVSHPQSTYICTVEYRAVSGVFQNIVPPPPPPSECVLPPHQGGGGTYSPGDEGVGGQYFGRRQTLDGHLTVYSLYAFTSISIFSVCCCSRSTSPFRV
jgi:hypothetical protein